MRRTLIRPVGLIALAGLIAACTSGTVAAPSTPVATSVATPSTAATPSTSADILADFDIGGGRKMHILCVGPIGSGRPTVIFESGLGGDAGQWSDVLRALGGTVRACAYDRAGNGQSEPATVGRTTRDQVADLRALLAAADVPGPYLLVGYSSGGYNVMVHAGAYPADVMGAVFADVRPPAASREWLAALPSESSTESEAIGLAREESTTFETDPTLNSEGLRLGASADEAIAADGLRDKPLVVLAGADTAAIAEGFEPALGKTMVGIWWKLQDALASSSTKGRLVKVDGTGHDLPFERPDAVADAIRELLGT